MVFVGRTGTKYETIDPAIGKGGEGSVYRVKDMPKYVLKVFIEKNRTETRHRKLLAMIASVMPDNALQQVTWPIDIIYENNMFVGYVMPVVSNNEDLNVMYSDKYDCTLSEKIVIAMNLCSAVNAVHNAGQVCGDLNPKNISVDPQHAIVTLVDTDSYHITDPNSSKIYRCEVGLPEYLPREIQEKMKNGQNLLNAPLPTFSKESDLFALAVHIFALLMNGCHPFASAIDNQASVGHLSASQPSVVNPQPIDNICTGFFPFYHNRPGYMTPMYAPNFNCLPNNIQKMFVQAFEEGHTNPKRRPDAVAWYNALLDMKNNLSTCSANRRHMFSNHLKVCPWCEVERKMKNISTPQLTQTSINTNQHFATPKPNSYQATNYAQSNINNQQTNRSNNGVGKWIAIAIIIVICFNVIRSCSTGRSSNNYNNRDDATSQYSNTGESYSNNNYENSDSTVEYEEPQIQYETIDVLGIEKKECSIDGLSENASSVGKAEISVYNGSISSENQEDVYTFVAPYDGRYRVDLTNMQNGTNVELYLLDDLQETICSDTYCVNDEGVTGKDLRAGATYTVKVRQDDGYTNYTMSIGMQKNVTDITGLTKITDSVEYTDQRNVYRFTVPIDGCYRFWISGLYSGTDVEFYIFNQLDETVASDTYCVNEEGLTVKDLKAGEIYEIQVRQDEGFSEYALEIGYQKPTVDLLDYSVVKDSVEYVDQRNVYTYTVPTDGRYRFEISGMTNGTDVELYVFDQLGEDVGSDTYCVNGEGVTLKDLKAGEVYEVQVRQDEGYSNYNLSIGRQKETTVVHENSIIRDSVEYTDQRNVYSYTAQMNGTVKITMSGLNSDTSVELYVFDDLGDDISKDTYCVNGDYVEISTVTKGTHYEIQVRQDEGFSSYELIIE